MPIPVDCTCGREFKVKAELGGKKIRCPDCKTVLTVPVLAAEDELETIEVDSSAPPTVAESPRKPEKVKAPRLPDEYAPSRTRADYDSAAKMKEPNKPRRSRTSKSAGSWRPAISVNPSIVTGSLMMIGAVVWFLLGLAANTIFIYPPIMFVLGIAAVFRGFRGQD